MAVSTSSSSIDAVENFSSLVDSVMEESSSTEPQTENVGVRTIINCLKSPVPSQLARKRTTQSNPPIGVKRRTSTVKADYEPKSVTHTSRVREFPGKGLTVSSGKESKAKQRSIAESLRKYDEECHPKGETLLENVDVYRVTVVKSFLKAEIPLSKVDCMRDLLEEHAFSLSGRQHLSETIPFIHQQEVEEIKKEISGNNLSVIFDGTTHVAEALTVLLRFVDNDKAKAGLFEAPEQEYDR